MRAYPFGLVFSDDLERAERSAAEHSKLRHRDPIALAACAAMAVGTALALAGNTEEAVVDAMLAAANRYSRPRT
jgi:ADP-ribosylglycohydrolase